MKRIAIFLLSIWTATGLYAQSWSPDADRITGEHESMVIDFRLVIDGVDYQPSPESSPYRIAAFVDGLFCGESQINTYQPADETVGISYFTLRVYGLTDPVTKENAFAGKEITFRIYDEVSQLEYILPDTYSYPFADGAHIGTLSELEALSFTTITGMYLTNEDIYPNTEYNLNDFVTFLSRGDDVTDGTRLRLTWSVAQPNSISSDPPTGFHLDASTGILMVTEDAHAGDYEYRAHTQGTTLKEQRGTLTLRKNAASIEVLRDPSDVLSGTNAFSGALVEGIDYKLYPEDAIHDVWFSYSNNEIIGEDGLLRYGSSEVTIHATSNDAVTATLTLNVYDDVSEFGISSPTLYLPDTVSDVDAWLKQHITLAPSTAKQELYYLTSSDHNIIGIHTETHKPVINALGEATLRLCPALTSGDQVLSVTLIVYHPIDELVVINDSYDAVLGEPLSKRVYESDATFYFAPQGSSSIPFQYNIADKAFLTADSCFAKLGSTTMTLWHPARPELQAQLSLHVYDEATHIEHVGDKLYVPRNTTDLMAYLHEHVSLVPATAKQEFKITSSSNAAVIGRQATGAPYSVRDYGTAGLLLKPTVTNANRSYLVTVVVCDPVTDINLLVDHIEGTVGENIHSHIAYGSTFGFEPRYSRNIITDFTVTPTDPTMIDADGNILRGGPTTVVIASVSNPEVKAELPVTLYDLPTDIAFIDGVEKAYVPDTCTDVDAWLKRYIQVVPATARQEFRYAAASPTTVVYLAGSAPNRYPVVRNTGEGTLIMAPAALPGKIKQFPIIVYEPVEEVTILQDTVIGYVYDALSDFISYGTHFTFKPDNDNVILDYTYTLSDPSVVNEQGEIGKAAIEGVTITVSPVTDPEVKGEYTLLAYDKTEDIRYDGERIYIPYDAADPASYIRRAVRIYPATARQDIAFLENFMEDCEIFELVDGQLRITGVGDDWVYVSGIDGYGYEAIPVRVIYAISDVVIDEPTINVPVSHNVHDYIKAGIHYHILPEDAPQSVIVIPDDTTMLAPDGTVLREGTCTFSLASEYSPGIVSLEKMTLNAELRLMGFTLTEEGGYHTNSHRFEKHTLTLVPVPDAVALDPDRLDVAMLDMYNLQGMQSSVVESCTPNYRADGTVKDFTIVVRPQGFGYADLMIEYNDEVAGIIDYSYNWWLTVNLDMPLHDGWNWSAFFEVPNGDYTEWDDEGNPILESLSYNYFNDADRFAGGLVDLRTQGGGYLHKDPVYGLFGHIDGGFISGAKINFDHSQASGLTYLADSTRILYGVGYMSKYRDGNADLTPVIHQGWNWIGYPYLYDYSIELLGIRTNDPDSEHAQLYGLPTDGDILLAHDGSMLVYDGTAHEWLTPDGGDYTFRYGQMYLYYTTRPDEPGVDHRFYWGAEATRYPIYDLTEEASLAPSLHREHSEWTYDSHRFADKMAIIARIDGLDNLEDYSIGAFVGDECRGEGRAVKDWMFITLSGEAKDHVTFRLLDKRTGLSYPLSESLRFGMLEGTLRAPYRFDVRGIDMGIAPIDEAPSLTILDDVVSAHGLIRVYDLQGKLVTEGHDEVSLAPLARGIYIIVTESGKIKVKR